MEPSAMFPCSTCYRIGICCLDVSALVCLVMSYLPNNVFRWYRLKRFESGYIIALTGM